MHINQRLLITPTGFSTLLLALLLALFISGSTAYAKEILKSPNDTRDYAELTLKNGLRVILVSDPDTDKAAASLDVNVGYFQDPEDRAGLAHFLEHMLFLGTKKYPNANAYKEFITSHGGSDNAYTASEHTNYFFDIDKDFLDETLDRFAQFFIAPLFDEEFVQREMNAVESEYRLKIKEDNRRIYQVFKATANTQHPFSKFSVGDLNSLSDRSDSKTRDELIKFHKKYYSANLMTLAIVGKEPINKLKAMAQRFSAIDNHHTTIDPINTPLYNKQQKKVRIDIVPLQETRSLTLSFTIPWFDRYHAEKPFMTLSHLLGYEGENSLYSLLKKRGWINALYSGNGIFAGNYSSFEVDVDLTKEGLKHTDEISTLIFQAIAMIRTAGVKKWIHDEMQQISDLQFRFREKGRPSSEAVALASNMHNYPTHLAIKGPVSSKPFSAKRIDAILDDLKVANLRQIVIAPELKTNKTEPYYNTGYSIRPLSEQQIKKWQQAGLNQQLSIPDRNPFIPEQTEVLTQLSGQDKPVIILEQNDIKVWHKQDDEFNVPKADISVGLATTRAATTIEQSIMTSLYIALAHDSLNEYAYPAALAGLHYSANKGSNGIGFSVGGYDDKQQALMIRIIDTLLSLKIDPKRFSIIKQQMQQNWENTRLDRPYQQLNNALNTLLRPQRWTPTAYLAAAKDISSADVEKHSEQLLQHAYISMFIHGNINREKATQLSSDIIRQLRQRLKPAEKLKQHAIKLIPQKLAHNFSLDIDHDDSAIISYHQAPDDSTQTQARNLLLLQLLEAPFFNQLRTAEQLGYVVYTGLSRSLRLPAIKFVIQSPVKGPEALLKHIDTFIVQQFDIIKNMSQQEFSEHKQAILTRLLEKDKRMSERTRRYQRALSLKYFDFNHREEVAEVIRTSTINDISDYYKTLLQSSQQRRIVLGSTGHKHRSDNIPPSAQTLDMNSIESFRQSQHDFSL